MENIIRIKEDAEIKFIEKKSVFIAFSTTVKNEEEALNIIKERKKKYQDATHNVYAYVTCNGNVARYSDDGEPQGTAGMPVLNAIRMSGVTDVLIVVTRYFGGTLLGASGLVRAYSASASQSLEKAGRCVYEEYTDYSIKCSYSEYQKLSLLLNEFGANMSDAVFSDVVSLKISVKTSLKENFLKKAEELFSGKIIPNFLCTRIGTS